MLLGCSRKQFAVRQFMQQISFYATATTRKRNLYHVLGVSPLATQKEIKNAFYRLSKKYHPDTLNFGGIDGSGRDVSSSQQKFLEIQEAYRILRGKESRAEYDKNLSRKAARLFTRRMQRFAQNNEKRAESLKRAETDDAAPVANKRFVQDRILQRGETLPTFSKQSEGKFFNPSEEMERQEREERWIKLLKIGLPIFFLVYFLSLRYYHFHKIAQQ